MASPVTSLIKWYSDLPVAHRQDIAAFICAFNLGFEDVDSDDLDNIHQQFVELLKRYENDKMKGTGLCLLLRSQIEFFFINKRGSKESWKKTEETLRDAKSHFAENGDDNMVASAQRMLDGLEFRSEQWIAVCKKWDEMRAVHLTDERIDSWFGLRS